MDASRAAEAGRAELARDHPEIGRLLDGGPSLDGPGARASGKPDADGAMPSRSSVKGEFDGSRNAAPLGRRLPVTRTDVEAAATAPDAKRRLGDVRAGKLHALEAYRFLGDKQRKTGRLNPEEKVKYERAAQALAEAVGKAKQLQPSPHAHASGENERATSIFREPELPMSDGRPVVVPEELFANLIRDMDAPHAHGTATKWNPFEGHSEALSKAALHHEARIANYAREHGVILDENGIPTWQGIGETGTLPVPAGEAKGKTLIHNHPQGSPPGWEDLIEACEQDAALLRIPTKNEVFSVVLIKRNPATYRLLRAFFQDIGDGTGREWMRRHATSNGDTMGKLMQHAIMAELDRRGYLKYKRERR